ncbi:pentatricopeptide repeat-containing protein At2g41080-like [Phragmites australis]|uniref:pentatricopeptide repeat-containing protein At2g41080-like n=1 Tax=Phragmites australis TaxID=29695 RepID=UPI002D767C18|nr:pentatricopeptide repeat-containing protein At2g41080-like [Phragmites australis]
MASPALKTLATRPPEAKEEIRLLCSSGRLRDALHGRFREVPLVGTRPLLACLPGHRALPLLRQLHAFATTSGAAADRFIANHLFLAYADLADFTTARNLFERIPKRNVMSWNILIGGYIKNGELGTARKLFNEMPARNVATWNAMTAGLTDSGLNEESLGFFAMRREGMQPFEFGLGSVFRCCAGLRDIVSGRRIHAYVVRSGVDRDMTQNGDSEGALEYFCMMRGAGVEANAVTFVSAISSCSDLAALAQGQQVHAQAIKAGVNKVVPVMTSLVHSAMISAYGFHGHGHKAVDLFRQMRNGGAEPNDVTFLTLLYACSHSGLKVEGMDCFELMTKTYGPQPSVKHYTCIVDLLGRSGLLNEVEALILSMPVRPDGVIWKTLLSSCKIQKNFDMANRIAERVIELSPHDAASYVLLSNIRGTSSTWEDVSEVRKIMRKQNVRKEPGISWVELKGQVHQFCTGDKSHSRQIEIDQCLEEMMAKIRQCGYAPDMSMVFHDLEDEEKEVSLAHTVRSWL